MVISFTRQRFPDSRNAKPPSTCANGRWLTAVAIVTATAISACGTQTTPTANATPGNTRHAPLSNAVLTREAGNCVDGTSSSANYYATQVQAVLADAVAAWASRPPTEPSAGIPAQLGLHFVLRSVTTTSYSTDGSSVVGTIPSVSALAPQPSPSDPSFDADIHAWTQALPDWKRV